MVPFFQVSGRGKLSQPKKIVPGHSCSFPGLPLLFQSASYRWWSLLILCHWVAETAHLRKSNWIQMYPFPVVSFLDRIFDAQKYPRAQAEHWLKKMLAERLGRQSQKSDKRRRLPTRWVGLQVVTTAPVFDTANRPTTPKIDFSTNRQTTSPFLNPRS